MVLVTEKYEWESEIIRTKRWEAMMGEETQRPITCIQRMKFPK